MGRRAECTGGSSQGREELSCYGPCRRRWVPRSLACLRRGRCRPCQRRHRRRCSCRGASSSSATGTLAVQVAGGSAGRTRRWSFRCWSPWAAGRTTCPLRPSTREGASCAGSARSWGATARNKGQGAARSARERRQRADAPGSRGTHSKPEDMVLGVGRGGYGAGARDEGTGVAGGSGAGAAAARAGRLPKGAISDSEDSSGPGRRPRAVEQRA